MWARFDGPDPGGGSFSCLTSQLRRLSVKQATPTYIFNPAHASDSSAHEVARQELSEILQRTKSWELRSSTPHRNLLKDHLSELG